MMKSLWKITIFTLMLTSFLFGCASGGEDVVQNSVGNNNPSDSQNNNGAEDIFTQPTPLPEEVVQVLDTIGESEFLRIAGTAPGQSASFVIDSQKTIQINWDQSSQGKFSFSITRLDEIAVDAFNEYVVTSQKAPGTGNEVIILPPGEYIVKVEYADSDWQIWLKDSQGIVENIATDGEFLHIKGNGPGASDTFVVTEGITFELTWSYSGVAMLAVYEIISGDGFSNQIPISAVEFSESGTYTFGLSEGEYRINVLEVEGDWEILIVLQ